MSDSSDVLKEGILDIPLSSETVHQIHTQLLFLESIINSSGNNNLRKIIDFKHLTISGESHNVRRFIDKVSDLVVIALSPTRIDEGLQFFQNNRGKVFPKDTIVQSIGIKKDEFSSYIYVLRQELKQGMSIGSIRGVGYVYGTLEEVDNIKASHKLKLDKERNYNKYENQIKYLEENRGKLITKLDLLQGFGIPENRFYSFKRELESFFKAGDAIENIHGKGYVYGNLQERKKIIKANESSSDTTLKLFAYFMERQQQEITKREISIFLGIKENSIFMVVQKLESYLAQYNREKNLIGQRALECGIIRGVGYVFGSKRKIDAFFSERKNKKPQLSGMPEGKIPIKKVPLSSASARTLNIESDAIEVLTSGVYEKDIPYSYSIDELSIFDIKFDTNEHYLLYFVLQKENTLTLDELKQYLKHEGEIDLRVYVLRLKASINNKLNGIGEINIVDNEIHFEFIKGLPKVKTKKKVTNSLSTSPKMSLNTLLKKDFLDQNRGILISSDVLALGWGISEGSIRGIAGRYMRENNGGELKLETVRGKGYVYGSEEERKTIQDQNIPEYKRKTSKKSNEISLFDTKSIPKKSGKRIPPKIKRVIGELSEKKGEKISEQEMLDLLGVSKSSVGPILTKIRRHLSKYERLGKYHGGYIFIEVDKALLLSSSVTFKAALRIWLLSKKENISLNREEIGELFGVGKISVPGIVGEIRQELGNGYELIPSHITGSYIFRERTEPLQKPAHTALTSSPRVVSHKNKRGRKKKFDLDQCVSSLEGFLEENRGELYEKQDLIDEAGLPEKELHKIVGAFRRKNETSLLKLEYKLGYYVYGDAQERALALSEIDVSSTSTYNQVSPIDRTPHTITPSKIDVNNITEGNLLSILEEYKGTVCTYKFLFSHFFGSSQEYNIENLEALKMRVLILKASLNNKGVSIVLSLNESDEDGIFIRDIEAEDERNIEIEKGKVFSISYDQQYIKYNEMFLPEIDGKALIIFSNVLVSKNLSWRGGIHINNTTRSIADKINYVLSRIGSGYRLVVTFRPKQVALRNIDNTKILTEKELKNISKEDSERLNILQDNRGKLLKFSEVKKFFGITSSPTASLSRLQRYLLSDDMIEIIPRKGCVYGTEEEIESVKYELDIE